MNKTKLTFSSSQSGMTLLEILMSLAIILTLSVGIGDMLRRSLDLKMALSEKESVSHRLVRAMSIISKDLEHAFIIPETDLVRMTSNRRTKTLFKIENNMNSDKVFMTTMSNQPILANSSQADTTYIVISLEDSKATPGRKDLVRGVAPRIPENFNEEPEKKVLISSVKDFKVRPWRGDEWSRDRWDTSRSEWKDKLPHLVLVELEVYNSETPPGTSPGSSTNDPTSKLTTVVYLQNAKSFPELKEQTKSVRWDKL